jgi:cobalt-precorrin 5A hydrolase
MTDSNIGNDPKHQRIALLAITRAGILLAARLTAALPGSRLFAPQAFRELLQQQAADAAYCYPGPTRAQMAGLFADFDGLIAVCSLGILVRLIAPHLQSKYRDPAVVVLDEAGRFAIPVLSGHLGGANALAAELARILGATPVLTTASDVRQTLAVDLLGRELGWSLDASPTALLRASAAMVNQAPVALVQESGSADWWRNHANGRNGPLPENLHCFETANTLDPGRFQALLWISQRPPPRTLAAHFVDTLVHYRPQLGSAANRGGKARSKRLALGLGCDRGTPVDTLDRVVAEALQAVAAEHTQVQAVASIDLKADEAGLAELAARHGWKIRFYSAAELDRIEVPNPSDKVRQYTGTASVSEAAALLASGRDDSCLLIEKHKLRDAGGKHATVSIARMIDD